MAQYSDWSSLSTRDVLNAAERRVVEQAATLLGVALPLNVAREAALVELIASANAYTDTEILTLINANRRFLLYQFFISPAFAISTNFDVKNAAAVTYLNAGTFKTLSINTNFDTGTAKAITASLFGAAVLYVTSGGSAAVLWATGAGYASEALAIAALVDPGATTTILGYVTVQAHASGFTAGTDALTTGTGGNVATATTYYNAVPTALLPGAAVS